MDDRASSTVALGTLNDFGGWQKAEPCSTRPSSMCGRWRTARLRGFITSSRRRHGRRRGEGSNNAPRNALAPPETEAKRQLATMISGGPDAVHVSCRDGRGCRADSSVQQSPGAWVVGRSPPATEEQKARRWGGHSTAAPALTVALMPVRNSPVNNSVRVGQNGRNVPQRLTRRQSYPNSLSGRNVLDKFV